MSRPHPPMRSTASSTLTVKGCEIGSPSISSRMVCVKGSIKGPPSTGSTREKSTSPSKLFFIDALQPIFQERNGLEDGFGERENEYGDSFREYRPQILVGTTGVLGTWTNIKQQTLDDHICLTTEFNYKHGLVAGLAVEYTNQHLTMHCLKCLSFIVLIVFFVSFFVSNLSNPIVFDILAKRFCGHHITLDEYLWWGTKYARAILCYIRLFFLSLQRIHQILMEYSEQIYIPSNQSRLIDYHEHLYSEQ